MALCLTHQLSAADWMRAESDHFVVHAELSEQDIGALVVIIEDFQLLLRSQLPGQTMPGRKLQIYLDKNNRRLSRAFGMDVSGGGRNVPEMAATFSVYDPSDEALFRHYSMFFAQTNFYVENSFFRPNPPWVSTGVPVFYATTYISEDSTFIIGAPDVRRPMQGSIAVSDLNDMALTDTKPRSDRAWARFFRISREATAPLIIEPQYAGVLENYLNAYSSGLSMEEAARELGDLSELNELIRERASRRQPILRQITLPPRGPMAITVRPMADDEVALVAVRFERLVDEERERTARKLSELTEDFPESALVWYEYAAAEFAIARASNLGGDVAFRGFGFSNGEIIVTANPYSDAKAWAAVNRALGLQPDLADAQILRAEILLSRLVKSGDFDDATAFDDVRLMLDSLASDPARNPLAAALFFQSFIEQGLDPSDTALDRLGRAFVANPGVEEFRYAYAVALARAGQRDIAEQLLTSMLNNPEYRTAAQRALDQAR